MRDLSGHALLTRVKGRPVLERRLRGLLLAVLRFSRTRATTREDQQWAARTADGLTALLNLPTTNPRHQEVS